MAYLELDGKVVYVVPLLPVVLASASPRRQELLRQLVSTFEVIPADVDEESMTVDDPWETATRLALAKAQSVAAARPDALIIGSDTVVAIEEATGFRQLAKPSDCEDAADMLNALSGRSHFVVTGIALILGQKTKVESDTTKVQFRPLSQGEISEYVANGEPMDKAGAYAIQGGAAGFVESVDGSTSNVIGLPLVLLERMLTEFWA
ncbi:MAG TPA: Maf family protein [Fimbriimonadaceae bacterium]|nr:Maf family protein [Fimbriimonadaceae bacterium]